MLVLYGNIFAAHVFYHLIALVPAFASMALVTAAAFFLAVRMNAQVIVVLGLLGGFLTPVLLSTGVDNPTALFGYIAVLNIGIAAVALRKRWDYLILLAAAGTVLIEFAWACQFFESPKANIAFAVFLGFEAQFLAICLRRARNAPQEQDCDWAAVAVLMGFSALAAAFCFLGYPELGRRPGFLFTFAFLAEAGLLALALLRARPADCSPRPLARRLCLPGELDGSLPERSVALVGTGRHTSPSRSCTPVLRSGRSADAAALRQKGGVAKLRAVTCRSCSFASASAKTKHRPPSGFVVLVLNVIAVGVAFARRSLPAVAHCVGRDHLRRSLVDSDWPRSTSISANS